MKLVYVFTYNGLMYKLEQHVQACTSYRPKNSWIELPVGFFEHLLFRVVDVQVERGQVTYFLTFFTYKINDDDLIVFSYFGEGEHWLIDDYNCQLVKKSIGQDQEKVLYTDIFTSQYGWK